MVETNLPEARRGEYVAPLAAGIETQASAVSWPAIFAGATAAAVLSLILLILGTGLGLSSVSPWADQGASAEAMGLSTILWLSFTQLASAGMGGYLAGRLRTRWASTHTDEVYFRDTAHGFLSWAFATLVTAAFLASAVSGIVSHGVQAGATVAVGGAATAVTSAVGAAKLGEGSPGDSLIEEAHGYFIDALFRKDTSAALTSPLSSSPQTSSADDGTRSAMEAGRIFISAMSSGALAPEDSKYLAQMVAQRTGLSQEEAEKRVSATFARMQAKAKEVETAARDAADTARKAAAYGSLWLFVSLLIGAFCASLAATFGGRQRDQV